MAIPSYWNTGFKKTTIASFTDVTDWITGIQTMLTATLDVADRWVESPAGTFTSPADPITGNQLVMVLTRTTALRLGAVFKQIVGGVTTAMNATFEADISGTVTATIFAGPKHFWTQSSAGEMLAIVMADPSPEPASGFSAQAIARGFRNSGQAAYSANADVWQGIADTSNGGIGAVRADGPASIDGGSVDEITAGGSFVYFPVAAVFWASITLPLFIGNLFQFVWVDGASFSAGSFVSVPIDVGVIGVFQVIAGTSRAQNGNGANLAVRIS
jgi:hypothetical protein